MKKNQILKLSLPAVLLLLSSALSAQTICSSNPIVEMLDSLVSLNARQKMAMASVAPAPASYMPHEIPTYSDDIYSSRIEKIQTPIDLTFNEQVKEYIDLYAVKKRDLTQRVMGLGHLYYPLFEQILDQQGLPMELKYLSVVESALNPVAVSCMGATGLWQFMLATGRLYDLKVNSYIDERKDPEKATLAACQYFKDMYAIYKDWLLVIASYNCGPGNVNKAIVRAGGKSDFWSISPYLPRETRGYVPAFVAVTYLMHYTAEHNLTAVSPIINYYEADTVLLDQGVSLRQVANSINVDEELLRYLNPVYKKGIIPESSESNILRLPSNKVNTFLANVNTILLPENTYADGTPRMKDEPGVTYVNKSVKKYHKVKRGERMAGLADRYDCTVQDIKRWNKLRSTKLATGQRLAVYVTVRQKVVAKPEELAKSKSDSATALHTTDSTKLETVPADSQKQAQRHPSTPSKSADSVVYHVVQPGDTLWNIALRYDGVTVQQLRKINRLNSNSLKVGTKLKVKVQG